jgi:hypothetical protein
MLRGAGTISRRNALRGLAAAGLSTTITPAIKASAQGAPAVVGKTKITVTGYYRTPPGDAPEEIIVIGGWRLPDLGSGWREKQEEQMRSGRARATLLPLYDPTKPPARSDGLWLSREAQRVGYIEVFRFRFGRRSDE